MTNIKTFTLGAFLISTLFLGGAATGTANKENLEKRDVCAVRHTHRFVVRSYITRTPNGRLIVVRYHQCGICGYVPRLCGNR